MFSWAAYWSFQREELSMRAKKSLDLFEARDERRRRERAKHAFPVAFGVQARVKNGHDAAIVVRAQQAPDPLLELEDHLWADILAKPVLPPRLHARSPSLLPSFISRLKRQPITYHQRVRLPRIS